MPHLPTAGMYEASRPGTFVCEGWEHLQRSYVQSPMLECSSGFLPTIGALIIRIGFGAHYTIFIYSKEHPK